MDLNGKTALVTGGAKRVGRAMCEMLAAAGCDVGIHYNTSSEQAEALAEQLRDIGVSSCAIQGDLNDPGNWSRIVRETSGRLGDIGILVNNASLFLTEHADDLDGFDPSHWEEMLRVNLLAPVGLVKAASGSLRATGGCVINLIDTSWESPWANHLSYGASKAALAAMTRSLAKALAPEVRVNGIAPGVAVFPESYDADKRSRILSRVPLEQAGTPALMAGVALAILQHGDYVTGEIIRVDGGRHLV